MSSIGGIGAAAVTTIGTLAVVGMAAKVAQGATRNLGKYNTGRRSYPKKTSRRSSGKRNKKSYSIWD